MVRVTNPSEFPEGKILEVEEPMAMATIIVPSEFIGAVMELSQSKRGQLDGMDYLSEERVEIRYWIPLAEIVFDYFDLLKSRTKGYASLNWQQQGSQVSDLVKSTSYCKVTPWMPSQRLPTVIMHTPMASR